MPQPLQPELVVADLPDEVTVSDRNEVIELETTAIRAESQPAFLRNDVVQFEFAHLHVEPGAAKQVVQPRVDRFKVEGGVLIRRQHEQERDILVERAARKHIETANIKTVGGDLLLPGRSPAAVSMATLLVLSRCQLGVMRMVTGQ